MLQICEIKIQILTRKKREFGLNLNSRSLSNLEQIKFRPDDPNE